MNIEILAFFAILLLGLLLCSFLGTREEGMTTSTSTSSATTNAPPTTKNNTSFDNYNHFNGNSTSATLTNGTTFYGPNGGSVVVSTDSAGQQSLQVKLTDKDSAMTFNSAAAAPTTSASTTTTEAYTTYDGNNGTATVFYGPNNSTATVVDGDNGQEAIVVQTSTGSYTFTQTATISNNNNNNNNMYYNDASAGAVTGPQGNTAYYAEGPNGNAVAGTSNAYYGPYGNSNSNGSSSAGAVTGPQGNTAYYAEGPNGNAVAGTTTNGISRNMIPIGDEDLYILKSQIVPPVCPMCPVAATVRQEPCPSCPPCGRCPEPSFECKKVPNYNAINSQFLPQGILSDFSSFGM